MQQDCPLSCPFLPVAASYRKLSMQRHVSKLGNLLQFGSSKRNDAKKILSVLPGDNVKTYVAGKYLFTFLVLSASHPGLPRHVHHDRIVNILRLFPKAAMTCDTEGTTPLHYVLRELRDARADMDIVYALLEAFPPAAFQQNSLGETPLHQLISSSPRDRPIDLAVMKAIVHSCPSSVREKTSNGKLPLHLLIARGHRDDRAAVQLLVQSFPESILEEIEETLHVMRVGAEGVQSITRRWSPLTRAAEDGDQELVNFFESQLAVMGLKRLSPLRTSRQRHTRL